MPVELADPEVVDVELGAAAVGDDEIIDDDTRPIFEIVDGEKVYEAMSAYAQQVGSRIDRRLGIYVEDAGLGIVVSEIYIACFPWTRREGRPDDKRRPDVAYWPSESYPSGRLPERGVAREVPAMCVEVLSPNDVALDLERKIADYFRAGVRLVWVVNPEARRIRTQQPDGTAHVYGPGDTITAAPVLPEFRHPVADLFPG